MNREMIVDLFLIKLQMRSERLKRAILEFIKDLWNKRKVKEINERLRLMKDLWLRLRLWKLFKTKWEWKK